MKFPYPQIIELDKQYHSLLLQIGAVTDQIYAQQEKENNEWQMQSLQKRLHNLTTTLSQLRCKINNLEVQIMRVKHKQKQFSSEIVLNGR